jgi:hypothetical protein
MCQIKVDWLFDCVWPNHIRKAASLFAQALRPTLMQQSSVGAIMRSVSVG